MESAPTAAERAERLEELLAVRVKVQALKALSSLF